MALGASWMSVVGNREAGMRSEMGDSIRASTEGLLLRTPVKHTLCCSRSCPPPWIVRSDPHRRFPTVATSVAQGYVRAMGQLGSFCAMARVALRAAARSRGRLRQMRDTRRLRNSGEERPAKT